MSVVLIAILINMIAIMVNRCLGYDNMFFLFIQTLASFIAAMGIASIIILNREIYRGFSKSSTYSTIISLAAITGWSYLFVESLRALIALN